MESDSRLLVRQTSSSDEETVENLFIVEDEIFAISHDEVRSIYGELATADIQSLGQVPVYQAVRIKFLHNTGDRLYSLIHLILLVQRLERVIRDESITYVETGDVHPMVELAVRDACENCGVATDAESASRNYGTILDYLGEVTGLWTFFLDQLLSIVLKYIIDLPSPTDIVVVPSVGRFESMEPVLAAADFDFEVIIPTKTLAWLLKLRRSRADLCAYSPTPIALFTTMSALVAQFKFVFVDLPAELMTERKLSKELNQQIQSEYDIDMSNIVPVYTKDVLTDNDTRKILTYFLIEQTVETTNASKLVVGGLSPLGRSVLARGSRDGCELYIVPHSLTTRFDVPIPFGATQFAEGVLAVNYVRNQPFETSPDNFRPLGRPYLAKLYSDIRELYEYSPNVGFEKDTLNIVVATQPKQDQKRKEFVALVLNAISKIDTNVSVIIKTHPGERGEFYYDSLKDTPIEFTVETDNLIRTLTAADVVLTVNSNVGFEAILADAACICVNLWEPLDWSMPYAQAGPISILQSENEINEEIGSLTISKVEKMKCEQFQFATDNVVLTSRCRFDIAQAIKEGI